MNRLPVVSPVTICLVPRPNGAGIARVLVLECVGDMATVLDIDPLVKQPRIFDAIVKGYASAIRVWDWIAAAFFWSGIAASFLWKWWVFLPAVVVAIHLWRMNRRSVAQFAAGALDGFPEKASAVFKQYGLIWEVRASRLVRDGT